MENIEKQVIMSTSSIVLIDAFSQIFRSFYAIRILTNSRGEPVNALLVFTRLLLGIENNYPGERGAMLFDCGKVQFRLDLLPEYKANRPPMPEALAKQIPFIREMAAAFGWQMLEAENYEADDLIGVIARNSSEKVRIISSDKDLSQLVDERVTLLTPRNGNSGGFEERDAQAVREKFGVAPGEIIDYLALLGDSSDNISGIHGIGPKGAAELINTYGTSENWIDDLSKLGKSKFFAKLDGNTDILRRNISLVKLRTDIPDGWNIEKLTIRKAPDWQKIRELCKHYGLKSILKDIPEVPETKEPEDAPALFGQDDLFAALSSPCPACEAKAAEPPPEDDGVPVQGELF